MNLLAASGDLFSIVCSQRWIFEDYWQSMVVFYKLLAVKWCILMIILHSVEVFFVNCWQSVVGDLFVFLCFFCVCLFLFLSVVFFVFLMCVVYVSLSCCLSVCSFFFWVWFGLLCVGV